MTPSTTMRRVVASSQGLQLGKGGLMTVPSSGPALLLATTLLFSPLLAADDPKYYNEKTNSEKLMPFVPLHAEQGLTRGDGSHGPPEEAGVPKPPGYAGSATNKECQYDDPEYSDCDPFTLKKTRTKNLIRGGATCGEQHVNETEDCSVRDFPPGTQWLIKEHKKCISELEHLKSLLSELHRWIDMIVERGQSLYKAFEDLRKHAEEISKQIKDVHKEIHDNKVLIDRLNKELEDWKGKARNLRGELDALKAKYLLLKKDHQRMESDINACHTDLNNCNGQKAALVKEIGSIESANRDLKAQLMDAEHFRLEAEKAQVYLDEFKNEVLQLEQQITHAKEERTHCRMAIVQVNANQNPKIGRDTHVNLDMKMWITHNQTVATEAPTSKATYYAPTQRIYKDVPITTYAPTTYVPPSTYTTTTPYPTTTTTTYKPAPPPTTTAYHPPPSSYSAPPAEYSKPGY